MFICLFVRPIRSFCECNSSEVIGPIAFIFGRMISHEVQLIILSRHFDLTLFVGVMRLLTFSCIFNIVILCECIMVWLMSFGYSKNFFFLAHLAFRPCELLSSLFVVVRPSTFHILIFSSETTWPIATKLRWNGPWMAPFQNYVR